MRRILLLLLLMPMLSLAEVKLPQVIGEGMVLQRNQDNKIWGWADVGEKVTVSFRGIKKSIIANEQGKWLLHISAGIAGGPFELKINKIVFKDVLVGDVWVCSGQSNMEFAVNLADNAKEAISEADYPRIRFFMVPRKESQGPLEDVESADWVACSPEVVNRFSAVGYFFGKALHEEYDIPIGLINTFWGGTIVETWMSEEAAFTIPELKRQLDKPVAGGGLKKTKAEEKEFKSWLDLLRSQDKGLYESNYIWAAPDFNDSNWDVITVPEHWENVGYEGVDGVGWYRASFDLSAEMAERNLRLTLGKIDDSDNTFVNGVMVGETFNAYDTQRSYIVPATATKVGTNVLTVRVEDYRGSGGMWGNADNIALHYNEFIYPLADSEWRFKIGTLAPRRVVEENIALAGPNRLPSLLFNGMISPIVNYGIKGVIWYQGESNADKAYDYRSLFPLMINDWRAKWGQGDFPFLYVQLANWLEATVDPNRASGWAELREAQTMALSLPNTGMAVAIDLGVADDIHPKNKLDVGLRLFKAARKVAYDEEEVITTPLYESHIISGNTIIIKFKEVGEGLRVKDKYGYVRGFSIAGEDGVWHWATAEIFTASQIMVYANGVVDKPVAVRYAWADNPADADIINSEGLPLSPFRTDSSPLSSQK